MHWRTHRPIGLLAIMTVALCAVSAAPGQSQENPKPKPDSRLDRRLAVEVRVADLGSLTEQLSKSLRLPLETDATLGARRVTIHAERTTVRSLQVALAALYRGNWQTIGEGDAALYRITAGASTEAAVSNLRRQRRTTFLNQLLRTEAQLARQRPEVVAASLRGDVGRRMPFLPESTLSQISGGYVNQALLASPLRLGLVDELARTGTTSVPLYRLSPAHQRLLGGLFMERYESGLAGSQISNEASNGALPRGLLDPRVLYIPQARLDYRLVFGDRWSGEVLVTRVGVADNWAAGALHSTLYDLPDYTVLYTTATLPPDTDKALQRDVNVNVDTDKMTWDQALLTVARVGKVNVVSDAFLRPEIFRPNEAGPIIVGTTLGETLSRIADYYGYIWWKQGDWYVFRHRMFGEYERTDVTPSAVRQIAESLSAEKRISGAAIAALAALDPDQLATMHLYARAAGKPFAPISSYDLNELDLARVGLLLYAGLTNAQRELARGSGLPFVLMAPEQQYLFTSTAAERGLVLDPYDRDLWRFRVREEFERERLPAGWAELGELRFAFDYSGADRNAELGIRVPALERKADTAAKK
jgi:hypothetical protein